MSSILGSAVVGIAQLGSGEGSDPFIVLSGIASTAALGSFTLAPETATIELTSIASTATLGSHTVVVGTATITLSSIASTATLTAPTLTNPSFASIILTSGIASTATLGEFAVINIIENQPLSVFIDGVNVSSYVRTRSCSITWDVDSRANCSFRIRPERDGNDTLSEITPAVHDEVIIYYNLLAGDPMATAVGASLSTRLFCGTIETLTHEVMTGTHGYYETEVKCIDSGALLDRRIVGRAMTETSVAAMWSSIVANELSGTGITFDGTATSPDALDGSERVFNFVTAGEVGRQLAQETDTGFIVDPYKRLKLFNRTTGTGAAPFSIADDDGNFTSLKDTTSRNRFWNRVYVRNSQDPEPVQREGWYADGSTSMTASRSIEGGMSVIAPDGGDISGYYERTGNIIAWVGPAGEQPSGGGTTAVIYPSKVSVPAIAQDAASIASAGLFEHVEEFKDGSDYETMQQMADAVLARGLASVEQTIDIRTLRPGLEPGQLLPVNANGVSGSFVIDQIRISELGKGYVSWDVSASKSSAAVKANAVKFFNRQIKSTRQPVNRTDQAITFHAAKTIEGTYNGTPVINPGITSGEKEAIAVARKPGFLKSATVAFKSVGSAPVIDVKKNGTSVFIAGGITGPSLSGEAVTTYKFAEDRVKVEPGDVFTLEVLSDADANTKDGFINLQIQG